MASLSFPPEQAVRSPGEPYEAFELSPAEAPSMTYLACELLRLDCDGQAESASSQSVGAQPLKQHAISAMALNLESSQSLEADVMTLIRQPDLPVSICDILSHPSAVYCVQQRVLRILREAGEHFIPPTGLDDLIRIQESNIRARGNADQYANYLVDLTTFRDLTLPQPESHPTLLHRVPAIHRDDTESGFDILSGLRPQMLFLNDTPDTFVSVFRRLTRNLLDGLDWNNVLVAGGMVLAALVQVDPGTDSQILDHDIDVFLYGLGGEAANAKIEEIHRVWLRNLPPSMADEKIVIRNTKTITFLARYPTRRLQIVLKLSKSATDVLLNFDLDQCAMGFNGRTVLMLPRCARALETGYTVFCSDLVHGSSGQSRRSTQIGRVLKYADRGYGVRFLPSYTTGLSEVASGSPPLDGPTTELNRLRDISQQAEAYVQSFRNYYMTQGNGALEVVATVAGRRNIGSENFSLQVSWNDRFYDDEGDSYDDPAVLDYRWDHDFHANELAEFVEAANAATVFRAMRSRRNRKAGDVFYRNPGEVQRYACGSDLKTVVDCSLCVPIMVPQALEATLSMREDTADIFDEICPPTSILTWIAEGDSGGHLPPGFSSDSPHGPIGSEFAQDEARSLRWWVVNNQTMWYSENQTRDNLTELFGILATWLSSIGRKANRADPVSERREREVISGLGLLQTATERKNKTRVGYNTSSARSVMDGLPPLQERSFFEGWVKEYGAPWPAPFLIMAPEA